MSSWKPSEGLTKAEMLVQILEVEARAAGSTITPVFRHRMVEMIAKTLDGGVVGVLTASAEHRVTLQNGTYDGAFSPHDVLNETVQHVNGPSLGQYLADQFSDMDGVTVADVGTGKTVKPAKAAKGKPAKKGKRGRPSKAELAARAAQG